MNNAYSKIWPNGAPDDFNPTPIELLLKDPSHGRRAITLPGHADERRRLDQVPDDLLVSKELECGGWCTVLRVPRKNLGAVYEFVYQNPRADLPGLAGNPDGVVELLGFWD